MNFFIGCFFCLYYTGISGSIQLEFGTKGMDWAIAGIGGAFVFSTGFEGLIKLSVPNA